MVFTMKTLLKLVSNKHKGRTQIGDITNLDENSVCPLKFGQNVTNYVYCTQSKIRSLVNYCLRHCEATNPWTLNCAITYSKDLLKSQSGTTCMYCECLSKFLSYLREEGWLYGWLCGIYILQWCYLCVIIFHMIRVDLFEI